MAEFELDEAAINKALEGALAATVYFIQDQILRITPRDLERLPQNINRKDGQAPFRSSYYKPVKIGGNWYEGISGKLKQSIDHAKSGNLDYVIGVESGPTSEYAKYLEFGTSRMRPRSFLRLGMEENFKKALEIFQSSYNKLLPQ